jgi:hypothetical protein
MGQDRCIICDEPLRRDDVITTTDEGIAHARCLPKTPRFPAAADDRAD